MADEPQAELPPAVTPGNSSEARTPTGEIKDQQTKQPDGSANQDPAKPAESKAEDKKPEAAVVPEKYEFKVPEGAELNEALIAEVTPLFKELGLSQEGAQKLFDFHNKTLAEQAEAPGKAYEDLRKTWRSEVSSSPQGDGKGGLRPEVKAAIGKAIDSLPNAKEFRAAMDLTGVGDHPAFVAAVAHWAKLVGEGTVVRPGGPAVTGQTPPGKDARPTPAQAIYPSLPSSASS